MLSKSSSEEDLSLPGVLMSKPRESTPIQKILVYPPPPAKGGIPINTEDYACLKKGAYLNDAIIDFYLRYFLDTQLRPVDQNRTHVFSSFFYQRLTDGRGPSQPGIEQLTAAERRHKRVSRWTKNVDLFSKDFIIIPVNKSCHWILAVVCFPGMSSGAVRTCDGQSFNSASKQSGTSLTWETGGSSIIFESQVPMKSRSKPDRKVYDEADANDGELEASDDESLDKAKEGDRRQPKFQPCILIFDSLGGAGHSKICATIREYLQTEWNLKHQATEGERVFDKQTMKGSVVKVPQQTNAVDCGVYLLQYFESFFKNPISDYRMPINGLTNWFDTSAVTKKRYKIQLLLHKLMKDQNVKTSRLNLPELNLQPDGTNKLLHINDLIGIHSDEEVVDYDDFEGSDELMREERSEEDGDSMEEEEESDGDTVVFIIERKLSEVKSSEEPKEEPIEGVEVVRNEHDLMEDVVEDEQLRGREYMEEGREQQMGGEYVAEGEEHQASGSECVEQLGEQELIREECVEQGVEQELIREECVEQGGEQELIREESVEERGEQELVRGECVEQRGEQVLIREECVEQELIREECVEQEVEQELIREECVEQEVEQELIRKECVEQGVEQELIREECVEQRGEQELIREECVEQGGQQELIREECVEQRGEQELIREESVEQGGEQELIRGEKQLMGGEIEINGEDQQLLRRAEQLIREETASTGRENHMNGAKGRNVTEAMACVREQADLSRDSELNITMTPSASSVVQRPPMPQQPIIDFERGIAQWLINPRSPEAPPFLAIPMHMEMPLLEIPIRLSVTVETLTMSSPSQYGLQFMPRIPTPPTSFGRSVRQFQSSHRRPVPQLLPINSGPVPRFPPSAFRLVPYRMPSVRRSAPRYACFPPRSGPRYMHRNRPPAPQHFLPPARPVPQNMHYLGEPVPRYPFRPERTGHPFRQRARRPVNYSPHRDARGAPFVHPAVPDSRGAQRYSHTPSSPQRARSTWSSQHRALNRRPRLFYAPRQQSFRRNPPRPQELI